MNSYTINNLVSRIKNDKLFKVTFSNGFATIIRMASSLATNKVAAILIGAKGFVLLGQIGNVYSIALTFLSGVGIGLTRYISQYKRSLNKTAQYISSGFSIYLMYSIILTVILLYAAPSISQNLLHSSEYTGIIIAMATTFILSSLNGFLLSIINGFQQHRLFVVINVLNSIVTLMFTISLMYYWNIYGALIANVTYLALSFFVTFYFVVSNKLIDLKILRLSFNRTAIKKLMIFSIMPLFSGIIFPVVQIIVRDSIIRNLGLENAGYWEAINRISNMQVLIITTSLSVYFLPRLSELKKEEDVRNEIEITLKKIIPPLAIFIILIITLREMVTKILFSGAFTSINELYLFQFSGNLFKIAGWIIAYRMLAKSMIKDYIITEVIYFSVYTCLSLITLKMYGLQGTTLSYLISYIIYFVYLAFRFKVFRKESISKEGN